MNDACANLVKKGIHVSVAAGNAQRDASKESPASEPTVCTVGASDSNDSIASFSNFGSLIDVFAPGVNIQSTKPNGSQVSFNYRYAV